MSIMLTQDEKEANARRIVACVNACEEINPEAVAELLEACKLALPYIERNGFGHNQTECCDALRSAIEKATSLAA